MKMIRVIIATMILISCSGMHRQPHLRPTTPNGAEKNREDLSDSWCLHLMESRDNWIFTAKLMAGVSGAGGLSTAAPDNENIRWGIGAASATVAAFGLAALWFGERKGDEFEEYCEMTMIPEPAESEEPAETREQEEQEKKEEQETPAETETDGGL